jgi:hypothetical protein
MAVKGKPLHPSSVNSLGRQPSFIVDDQTIRSPGTDSRMQAVPL